MLSFDNCTITNNTHFGSDSFILASSMCNICMKNTKIMYNSPSITFWNIPFLQASDRSVVISGCLYTGNFAGSHFLISVGCKLIVNYSMFVCNSFHEASGYPSLFDISGSSVSVEGSTFKKNNFWFWDSFLSYMFVLHSSNTNITNCLFQVNWALPIIGVESNSPLNYYFNIRSCTFLNNSGDSIAAHHVADVNIQDTEFYLNSSSNSLDLHNVQNVRIAHTTFMSLRETGPQIIYERNFGYTTT